MSPFDRIDALSARLADTLRGLESDPRTVRPPDLAFVETQTAEFRQALVGLPASERDVALGKLTALSDQLVEIERRIERHLAALSQPPGADGPETDRTGS